MFLTAYPSADVLSQEAHEAIAKQRASGMFQGFLNAIREAVKIEKAALQHFADRNLSFTRMATGLQGTVAKEAESKKAELAAHLLVN